MDRVGEVRAAFADVDLRQLRHVFAYGVAYGVALERERVDAEDDALHRAAAADVVHVVATVDRWHAAR